MEGNHGEAGGGPFQGDIKQDRKTGKFKDGLGLTPSSVWLFDSARSIDS